MARPVITLLTDFGLKDTFVGQMKGVLLTHCPEASLVDLTHQIPPQAILQGTMHLAAAWSSFPTGTVHLAVVDPGVGTSRRALAVRYREHHFVLPDNGLVSGVLGGDLVEEAVRLTLPADAQDNVSRTFHGRDVFSPAAGKLAAGVPLSRLGEPVLPSAIERFPLPVARLDEHELLGEIVIIDRFGNAVTNIRRADFPPNSAVQEVRCEAFSVDRVAETYQDVQVGHTLALVSSMNTVELAVRDGSAARRYHLTPGMKVTVHLSDLH